LKKGRKKIRRNPGKKRNMYFNKDTQQAILDYQDSECSKEKEELYKEKICKAFEQLAESLIFVYGFKTNSSDFASMKNDCVTFLYETIFKWDHKRGTKAFSYFNVVAKNWLIAKCRNAKKLEMRNVSMADMRILNSNDKAAISNAQVVPSPEDMMVQLELKGEIFKVLSEIKKRITRDNEKLCLGAIKTVFENIDNLDFLNKRAIYVYVREISGLNSKQLSVAMSKIRKHYNNIVHDSRIIEIF